MAKYKTDRDLWLSHECRSVKAGEVFETEFPNGPKGKPMELGEHITLVDDAPKAAKGGAKGAAAAAAAAPAAPAAPAGSAEGTDAASLV